MLVNYIDFETLTGTTLKSDLFNLPLPDMYRQDVEAVLQGYSDEPFQGRTAWDLVVFVFQHVWNEMIPVGHVDVEITSIGGKNSVLLGYNGTGDLGFVSFSTMGTRAALLFNVAKDSAWTNATIFKGSIFTFVEAFLRPVKDILHAAYFNQYPILSGPDSPVASVVTFQGDEYMGRESFMQFAGNVLGAIPSPAFPVEVNPSQVFFTLGVCLMVAFIVYYAVTSYKKEQQRIHQGSDESA